MEITKELVAEAMGLEMDEDPIKNLEALAFIAGFARTHKNTIFIVCDDEIAEKITKHLSKRERHGIWRKKIIFYDWNELKEIPHPAEMFEMPLSGVTGEDNDNVIHCFWSLPRMFLEVNKKERNMRANPSLVR